MSIWLCAFECALRFKCVRVCVCISRGLWLMGSLLMLSQDYRWLQRLDTKLTSVQIQKCTTYTHIHTGALTLSILMITHIHTHFHFFWVLTGTLMHINLQHQQINSCRPDILLSTSLDIQRENVHAHIFLYNQGSVVLTYQLPIGSLSIIMDFI